MRRTARFLVGPLAAASWLVPRVAAAGEVEASALTGGAGLVHTEHAPAFDPRQPLRLALTFDGVSAGSLCTTSQPCVDSKSGAKVTSDSVKQLRATLGGSVQLAGIGDGALEAIVASRVSTTSDDVATVEKNLTVVGATNLGLRYGVPLSSAVRAGAQAALVLPGSRGFGGFDLGATGARLGALLSADLLPIRVSANATYTLDNSAVAISATESKRGAAVSRIERFGVDASRVDHVDLALGAEALLAGGALRPFVEYSAMVPVGRQGYHCNPLDGTDRCLADHAIVPSSATLGLRAFPSGGLDFVAGLDIGVTGTGSFIAEVTPNVPYRIYLGASYELGLSAHAAGPQVVQGAVRDADGEPIAGARVRAGAAEATTDEAGAFVLHVTGEAQTLTVSADGFRESPCLVEPDVPARCALALEATSGTLVLALRDGPTGAPAAGVEVRLRDARGNEVERRTNASGVARFAGRPAGPIHIQTDDDAHLFREGDATIVGGEVARIEWPLLAVPSGDQAGVVADDAGIHLRSRVAFNAEGTAVDPASQAALVELAHALRRRPEPKLVVVAYADGTFGAEDGAAVADARAAVIVAWLGTHGVPANRLVARGAAGDAARASGTGPRTVRVDVVPDTSSAPTPTPP